MLSCSSPDQNRVINATGTVLSNLNAQPVEGITVALKKQATNNGWGLVQHTTTDAQGQFQIFFGANIPGNFRIDVNSVPDLKAGCGSQSLEVFVGVTNLGDILIDTDSLLCQ